MDDRITLDEALVTRVLSFLRQEESVPRWALLVLVAAAVLYVVHWLVWG